MVSTVYRLRSTFMTATGVRATQYRLTYASTSPHLRLVSASTATVIPSDDRYPEMAAATGTDGGGPIPFHISNRTWSDALDESVLSPLLDEGVDFFWTDWQFGLGGGKGSDEQYGSESFPGTIDVAGLNPTLMLNHVRFNHVVRRNLSARADSERQLRGAVLSRYGGLPNHRYAVGFGGDVFQSWESLRGMIVYTSTAANVAFAYW
jgi:hypothetical protein